MDTVPYILGIAHAPGYPLYTLLGWLWSHALPVWSVALRMSLFSALSMALAVWVIYRIVSEETKDAMSAALAAFLFAAGGDVWLHATRAEPHALSALAFAVALYFFLRWYRVEKTRDLYLFAVAFGCGVAVHPILLFMLPGIVVLIVARLHEVKWQPIARAAGIALVSALIWFAYFPLRSAYVASEHLDPLATLGVIGGAFWDNEHPLLASGFVALVTGGDVDVSSGLMGYASPRFVFGVGAALRLLLTSSAIVGCVAAVVGVVAMARADAMKALGLIGCAAGSAVFACGFSDESDIARYFLPSLIVLAVFCGIGIAALRGSRGRQLIAPLGALAIVAMLAFNRDLFTRPMDGSAERDVDLVLATTPGNAILVANWMLAPPLAYASYVERRAGDRIVVPAWHREVADAIPGWSKRRPVYLVERRGSHVALRLVTR